jgi:choline kinase
MVPLFGRPMIERALEQLAGAGITATTIVTGYLADRIEPVFGASFGSMALRYLPNPEYATTNNIVSLWLARDLLDRDVLLLEADLVFDDGLLRTLVAHPAPNVAVVDRFAPPMDGTVIVGDGDRAERMVLKVDQGAGFSLEGTWKTVNVYKLSGASLRDAIVPGLDRWVREGRTDRYYEAVFAEAVASGSMPLHTLPTGAHRWAEVDDLDDLRRAEAIFGAPAR